MKLNKTNFIEKSKELGINYEKYINKNAFEVEELMKNENFLKKEIRQERGIQFDEIGDKPSKGQIVEDTYYYFSENGHLIILIETFSNFKYRNDEHYQEEKGEIKKFIID